MVTNPEREPFVLVWQKYSGRKPRVIKVSVLTKDIRRKYKITQTSLNAFFSDLDENTITNVIYHVLSKFDNST